LTANDRRMQLLDIMRQRRHGKINDIAVELGVSRYTIMRDIGWLTCSYPIYTTTGNGGGVHIVDGYHLGMKYMTDKQALLLEKLSIDLVGDDLQTMKDIIKLFKRPYISKQ